MLLANIANRIPNPDRITVRHLLNHSSGLFNYIDNERYEKETFSEGTLDNVIDWAFGKGSKPPAFAPGTGFEYSDTTEEDKSLVSLVTNYFTKVGRVTKDVTDSGDVVGTGDGRLISNAEDLARFAQELLGGRTLLNEKFFHHMVNFNKHVGLGVFEEEVPGGRAWGHSGSWHGYTAQMYFLPDQNVAAALGNGSNADPTSILKEALGLLF